MLETMIPESMLDLAVMIERSHSQPYTVSRWEVLNLCMMRGMTLPYWLDLILERAYFDLQHFKDLHRSIAGQR